MEIFIKFFNFEIFEYKLWFKKKNFRNKILQQKDSYINIIVSIKLKQRHRWVVT